MGGGVEMWKGVAFAVAVVGALLMVSAGGALSATRFRLDLVGGNGLMVGSQTSDIDADPTRDVAYLGSFVDLGVAVVDISDRAHPSVVGILSTDYVGADDRVSSSDSADVDLNGNLLAVASQAFTEDAFAGVSLYDITDPFEPLFLSQVWTGGTHDVQIDPGWPARPYVYSANFESDDSDHGFRVSIINASDPTDPVILTDYESSEPQGEDGLAFNSAHDLTLLVHPDTGRVLLYVAYWDSGLRIVDVTNPEDPEEIGALDYTPSVTSLGLIDTCCAHYAQPTPSGDYVLLEDEVGIGLAGGVHILRADGCDGVNECALEEVGFWDPPIPSPQAMAVMAEIHAGVTTNGLFQRFFTRDVHNLDVQEDRFLAAVYSSGVYLVDMADKSNPRVIAFWTGAANVKTACHGKNTLIPWGYQGNCYFQGREVWGAKFGDSVPGSGSDFYIYASDFWLGLLIFRTVSS